MIVEKPINYCGTETVIQGKVVAQTETNWIVEFVDHKIKFVGSWLKSDCTEVTNDH